MPVSDDLNWSELAYDLGLQGLAQELAVNSVVSSNQDELIRLSLSPELREIANPAIVGEIQQAIDSRLHVSCRLELVASQEIELETPFEARQRQQEAQRQAAIAAIRDTDIARKFHRAFGAELVESSVRKIDE